MVSEHQTAGNNLNVNNEQSHLLKLLPEVRLRIYEYVLADRKEHGCHLSTLDKPRRPSLLQVCQQLRNESRLMYHEHTAFIMIASPHSFNSLRRWAATLNADEIRKIKTLTFRMLDLTLAQLREFREILSEMIRRGLARSALHLRTHDNRTLIFDVDVDFTANTQQAQG